MDNFRIELILNRQKEIQIELDNVTDNWIETIKKLYKEKDELKILECKIIVKCLN